MKNNITRVKTCFLTFYIKSFSFKGLPDLSFMFSESQLNNKMY